jgi:murein DD-endopeptidase MepM/ murein hydrolase activator NlpD
MAYNPDPRLVQAIRQNGGKLAPILLATALVESGGRLDAVGDGGRSHGPYQMYDLGRGAGVPISKRRDPVFSTKAALREFQTFYGRGARGADLAYRAQRPADRAGYISKISAALPYAQQLLGAGAGPAVPPATGTPAPGDLAKVSGSLDVKRLMGILNATSQRALRGEMPGPNYGKELQKLAMGALPRAQVKAAGQQVGAQAAAAAQTVAGAVGGLTMGGGPSAHHSRALGNWQSDDAYDLMGKAGQAVHAPFAGTVVKISGQPGGDPGFAGYGVTIRDAQGNQYFFKHLGTASVKPGQRIKPGQLIGTLDAKTAGGPHLHLGGTNSAALSRLAKLYTRKT